LREDLLAKGHKPPKTNKATQLHATWINTGKDPKMENAELWYDEGMFWGKLGPGDEPLAANTYEGHRWNVRVDGDVVHRWEMNGEKSQVYRI
jgi:hypothetical protein